MDATIGRAIGRTAGGNVELALEDWLKATRALASAALSAAGHAVVSCSRAGLMVRNGSRQLRRL